MILSILIIIFGILISLLVLHFQVTMSAFEKDAWLSVYYTVKKKDLITSEDIYEFKRKILFFK